MQFLCWDCTCPSAGEARPAISDHTQCATKYNLVLLFVVQARRRKEEVEREARFHEYVSLQPWASIDILDSRFRAGIVARVGARTRGLQAALPNVASGESEGARRAWGQQGSALCGGMMYRGTLVAGVCLHTWCQGLSGDGFSCKHGLRAKC